MTVHVETKANLTKYSVLFLSIRVMDYEGKTLFSENFFGISEQPEKMLQQHVSFHKIVLSTENKAVTTF
jgi:hypothetical protein